MAANPLGGKMSKILAIIDGDGMVHRAEWKRTFHDSKLKVDEIMDEILCNTFADDYKLAIKGDNNFRKDLCPDYKRHRNRSISLEHRIAALLQYMVDEYGAVRAHGWEADDHCHMWHKEAIQGGEVSPVICSIDKDMYTITGTHYTIRNKHFLYVDENEADYNLHCQLLMGDHSDGIKGIPGIGPKKAKAYLEGVPFGARKEKVVEAYKDFFQKDWEEALMLTGNLIYIRHDIEIGFEI